MAVIGLLVFHCYLNCVIRKPTYQFFKDRKNRKYEVGDKLEYKNYVGEVLVVMDRENRKRMEMNENSKRMERNENSKRMERNEK